MNSTMAAIDELIIMDEYANEKIRREMVDRLASISANRINQEITKRVLWRIHPLEIHLVGSSYEGFPVSAWGDEDKMLYNTTFPMVLWTPSPKKGGNCVMAEQDVNKPVYMRLKVVDTRYLDKDIRNIIDDGGYLKNSDFMKANSMKGIYPNLDTEIRQGPSMVKISKAEFVDIRTEMGDTVYCLKCQSWPPFTSKFFARGKLNNWPPQKLLDKVKGLECYVVPVGCPGSETYDIEWRLSFSVAEKELVTELHESYANCMFALKLIKKKYIIYSDSEKPTPFCSYFIKTACLWMCETFPHLDYSIMDLIRKVLDWLIDCYQHKHLPHYFIPQHNLIGHLSRESCDNVRQQLKEVEGDLWTKVLLSIDSEEDYDWYSKFDCLGDTLNTCRDNRENIEQELGQRYRTFVGRVNTMRLMNHPGTTEVIRDMLCAVRSENSLHHNLLMEQWAFISILRLSRATGWRIFGSLLHFQRKAYYQL
ncbi:uncharacterized protein LOC117118053 [Anneissia japonica]|uniref:uncharacterized protein LOC117118053 n=1 Tax=Anneissia japonica TaxID=1529436 RepID=UPI0014259C5B|nr:uncharacterized protein LOC117118053 [Anneissia japonica]